LLAVAVLFLLVMLSPAVKRKRQEAFKE